MKAMKANKIVQIDSKKKDEYLANGYTILDDTEKVIAAPAKDAEKLGKEVDELKKVIAKKDEEIARLNAMIVDLQSKADDDEDKKPAAKKTTAKK